jgi:predicted lipoprotein with Yx(FWY)xxD motif
MNGTLNHGRGITVKGRLIIIGIAAVLALAVGVALAIAAGSGGTGGSGGATVSVKKLGAAGKVLVDAKGRPLYRNDQERGKMVLCVGQCVNFWKPLISKGAPKGKSLPGKLALEKRPGGAMQVTYNGKRLYTFTLDRPGKVAGDNFRDSFGGQAFTWHVLRVGKGSSSSGSDGDDGYGGYGYGG